MSKAQSLNEAKMVLDDIEAAYSEKVRATKTQLESYMANLALVSALTKVAKKRIEIIKQVDEVRDFYLVDAILQQYVEDALSPDISSGEIINVYSDKKSIDKELRALDEKLKFDALVQDITPDLLAYGEYTLSTEIKNGQGLVDIKDDVDQASVFAIPKAGGIDKYLVRTEDKGKKAIEFKEPYEYVKFVLSGRRLRLDLKSELGMHYKKIKDKIPRFIRVGRSLIYSIIPKVKELQLLETIVPASKLNKLTQGSVIGVSVPSNMPPERAFKVAKQVEDLLNKKIGVNTSTKSLAIEDAIATAGRLRVVPIFGDKGTLNKFDYKMDEPDDLMNSIEDLRRVICNSAGIPYEILFGGDSTKGEMLKRYARYLRRLKAIQRAISNGVRQIVYIHLTNKGISFVPADIKVEFRNKLVEIDNLDALEFLDTSIGMLDNVKNFVYDLASEDSPFADRINLDRFAEILNEQLSIIGLAGIVREKPAEQVLPEQPVSQGFEE